MLTMLSIFFFFMGIVESKFRKTTKAPKGWGIPRTFKRVQYIQLNNIQKQELTKVEYRTYVKPAEWSL